MTKTMWVTAGVALAVGFVLLVALRALADRGTDPVGDLAAAFRPGNGGA
jgi:hypothetical protein